MTSVVEWAVEEWISEDAAQQVDYADYWNDPEHEKAKEWYILDGDFERMEAYLERINLPRDLARAQTALGRLGRRLEGTGIDLAAGTLWAAPYLAGSDRVDRLYCLEYSRHRLLEIGPAVLEHYHVPPHKIVLVRGSFYDLHLTDASMDFVFMSQALHHADDPHRLLREVRRVLKRDGVAIVLGEHVVSFRRDQLRRAAKYAIATLVPADVQRRVIGRVLSASSPFASARDLYPPDPILGDHYYTWPEYREMFATHGFRVTRLSRERGPFQSFLLDGGAAGREGTRR